MVESTKKKYRVQYLESKEMIVYADTPQEAGNAAKRILKFKYNVLPEKDKPFLHSVTGVKEDGTTT